MARLRTEPETAAREAFRKEIRVRRAELDMNQRGLADSLGVVPSVMSKLLAEPDKISVERLRKIVKTLAPDPIVILKLLGYDNRELKRLTHNPEVS